jgi:hypothetical protein
MTNNPDTHVLVIHFQIYFHLSILARKEFYFTACESSTDGRVNIPPTRSSASWPWHVALKQLRSLIFQQRSDDRLRRFTRLPKTITFSATVGNRKNDCKLQVKDTVDLITWEHVTFITLIDDFTVDKQTLHPWALCRHEFGPDRAKVSDFYGRRHFPM